MGLRGLGFADRLGPKYPNLNCIRYLQTKKFGTREAQGKHYQEVNVAEALKGFSARLLTYSSASVTRDGFAV